MSQVQFDEEKEFTRPALKNPNPKTALDSLMKLGVVSTASQASAVLLLVAVALVYGAYYFFTNSFPETPTLGKDILKPGEVIPDNRNAP